ncbi:hypothetical protein OHT02_34410 [Streptomyces platensis]
MTALARSERAARTVSDLGATPVAGALTDTDVLREAAQGRRGHSPRGDYAEGTADVDRAGTAGPCCRATCTAGLRPCGASDNTSAGRWAVVYFRHCHFPRLRASRGSPRPHLMSGGLRVSESRQRDGTWLGAASWELPVEEGLPGIGVGVGAGENTFQHSSIPAFRWPVACPTSIR